MTQATMLHRRRIELLAMVGATRPDRLPNLLRSVVRNAAPQDVLFALRRVLPFFRDNVDPLNSILAELKLTRGAFIGDAITAFKAEGRVEAVMAVRDQTSNADARLLLALLLNAQSRSELLEMVQLSAPVADPIAEVIRLSKALLREGPLALRAALVPEQDGAAFLSGLTLALGGRPLAEIADGLSGGLAPVDSITAHRVCATLASSPLFRGLFS